MSKACSLLTLVKKSVDYVELMKTTIAPSGSQQHKAMQQDCAAGILKAISQLKALPQESVQGIGSVCNDKLTQEQVHAILQACSSKVHLAGNGGGTKKSWQQNYVFDEHLTEQLWQFFLSDGYTEDQVLSCMACQFAALGLFDSDEKTKAFGAAIATQRLGFDRNRVYNSLVRFKAILTATLRECKHRLLEGPSEYNVVDLWGQKPELYRQAFPDAAHANVPSKWNKEFRAVVLHGIPCRYTKMGVVPACAPGLARFNPATLTPPTAAVSTQLQIMQHGNPALQALCARATADAPPPDQQQRAPPGPLALPPMPTGDAPQQDAPDALPPPQQDPPNALPSAEASQQDAQKGGLCQVMVLEAGKGANAQPRNITTAKAAPRSLMDMAADIKEALKKGPAPTPIKVKKNLKGGEEVAC